MYSLKEVEGSEQKRRKKEKAVGMLGIGQRAARPQEIAYTYCITPLITFMNTQHHQPALALLSISCGDESSIHRINNSFISHQKWKVSQTKIRVISTLIFILFGCLIFVALPVVIFKQIEGWSTLESIYFVVITLTTIGFGDFVAGEKGCSIFFRIYRAFLYFYVLESVYL